MTDFFLTVFAYDRTSEKRRTVMQQITIMRNLALFANSLKRKGIYEIWPGASKCKINSPSREIVSNK